jgi:hypothetical protein
MSKPDAINSSSGDKCSALFGEAASSLLSPAFFLFALLKPVKTAPHTNQFLLYTC